MDTESLKNEYDVDFNHFIYTFSQINFFNILNFSYLSIELIIAKTIKELISFTAFTSSFFSCYFCIICGLQIFAFNYLVSLLLY